MRKTVAVGNVREYANAMLANSNDNMVSERHGIIALVEKVLHETDNYCGFNYIGGYVAGMDESRRYYY